MYRFPLTVAFAQLAAIRELDGIAPRGPSWGECAAARALEVEEARLLKLYQGGQGNG